MLPEPDVPDAQRVTSYSFDAFVSYSHALDGKLAPTLHRELERFAKPWYRMRALRVFRDDANLAATPGLWSAIEGALAVSRWLIVMASPEAARSPWVDREISWWLAHRSPDRIVLVVTSGEFSWNQHAGHAGGTALPPALRGAFAEEPRWVDLRWLHRAEQVDRSDPRLREAVADIAAALRGVPKDLVIGEHIRRHRTAMRLAWAAGTALTLLLVLSMVAGTIAVGQRNEAQEQTRIATSRALAAESDALASRDPLLAARLAVAGYRLHPTAQSTAALMRQMERLAHVTRVLAPVEEGPGIAADAVFSPDGSRVALAMRDDSILLWDLSSETEKVLRDTRPGPPAGSTHPGVLFTPDGRKLISALAVEDGVESWDVETGQRVARISTPAGVLRGLSTDGRYALLAGEYIVDERDSPLLLLDVTLPDAIPQPIGNEKSFPKINGEIVVGRPGDQPLHFFTLEQRSRYLPESGPGIVHPVWSDDRSVQVALREQRSLQWRDAAGAQLHDVAVPSSAGRWQSLAVSGDGSTAVLGDDRGRVLLARGASDLLVELAQLPSVIQRVAVDPTGRRAVAVDVDGNAVLAEPDRDLRFSVLPGTQARLDADGYPQQQSLVPSQDGRWLLAFRDDAAELWDLAELRLLHVFPIPGGRATAGYGPWHPVRFGPDSRTLGVLDGERVRVLSLPGLVERSAVPRGEGEFGLAAAFATALGAWQGVRDEPENRNPSQRQPVSVVGVGADGSRTRLSTGGYLDDLTYSSGAVVVADSEEDGIAAAVTVTSWSRSGGAPRRIGRTTADGLVQAAVSSDGRHVVTNGGEGGQVVDLTEHDRRVTLAGGRGRGSIRAMAFAGHDLIVVEHVAPQREEDTLHNRLVFWDRTSGDLVGEWEEPMKTTIVGGQPIDLVPAGDSVLTIRPDGSIAMWNADPASWARALCSLGGELTGAERQKYLAGFDPGPVCRE